MVEIIEKLQNGKCIGRCECGIEKEFYTQNIARGRTKSCGCLHTKPSVPKDIKRAFNLMRYRCNTKTSSDYKNYGAKGIKVLYATVEDFYADVGDKPSKSHTIDRINVYGNYEIGNCRWATRKEQSNNLSVNNLLEFKGKIQSIALWSEETGIKYTTIRERLKRGWSIEKALTKGIRC